MKDVEKRYDVAADGRDVVVKNVDHFDPDLVFDCGQTFRFSKDAGGVWRGVAMARSLAVTREGNDLRIFDCDEKTFYDVWYDYLGLALDYDAVGASFPTDDLHLAEAAKIGSGIRILRQDRWEALCSFIISQNNNIPRISMLVERLCNSYGKEFSDGKEKYRAFPTPEELADVGEADYARMGMGYRASYLVDAVGRVLRGETVLEDIDGMTTAEATDYLKKIKGVGTKVASCALLFGFSKYDAFPVDVWVRRIIEKYYPDTVGHPDFGKYAGIAQQYLFYYERYISDHR